MYLTGEGGGWSIWDVIRVHDRVKYEKNYKTLKYTSLYKYIICTFMSVKTFTNYFRFTLAAVQALSDNQFYAVQQEGKLRVTRAQHQAL